MANFVKLTVFFLLAVFAVLVAGRDYYDILSVPKGASDSQIKRSYRKLALQYHPDKVSGSEEDKQAASKKFTEINSAYEALSDPEKRKVYDQYGEEGLKQQEQRGGQRQGNSMFDFFFGGGGNQDEEDQVKRGHDVYVDLPVTLKDLYVGKEIKAVRDKNIIKPASGTRKCKCKQKLMTKQLGPGMFQQYTQNVCQDCPNVKLSRTQEPITVHVEPGMINGEFISFFEEGEPMIDGEPGDLKFVIRLIPDPRFERRTNDLMFNYTISLVDALTGFSHEIEHLDGHKVTLAKAGVTKPLEYVMIENEGMPIQHQEPKRGNMWVQYTVAFPEILSEQQKETVRALFP
jgi:DnaJ family protein B protein 11